VSGLVLFGYTIVVVDDGSAASAESCLAGLSVYCVRHGANLGHGAALQTGTEFAVEHGASAIAHFDADGQHDPALIERLLDPIVRGRADVVLGSRFLDPADRLLVPQTKRILLKLGAIVFWAFSGIWLTDAHNGFRAFSRKAVEKVHMRKSGFAHATEILDLLRRAKLPYVEVPATSMFNGFDIVIDLMLRKLFK